MNPQTDKIVRRTAMVATAVFSYFLFDDYGPEPNVLDPIKRKIFAAHDSVLQFFFPPKGEQSRKAEESDNAK